MDPRRKKVLASIEWFSPAYRAGGIISSLKNQIGHLKDDIEFWVVTGNRDLTHDTPVSRTVDCWIRRQGHHVHYSSNSPDWSEIVETVKPDIIYVNGLFNGPFNRSLLRWCRRRPYPIRLASHGMLAPNALRIKSFRKKTWLTVERLRGTFHNVEWHATSEMERKQVLKWFPYARVHIAQNLPPRLAPNPAGPDSSLTFLSVGRVHPIKNYSFAAGCLSLLAQEENRHIAYGIVGPVEDESEKKKIQQHQHPLLTCELRGEVGPEQLPEQFEAAHALLVPSLSENYGQVVAEALAHGLPVLVSDQTPWSTFPESKAIQCLALEHSVWIEALRPLLDRNTRMALIQPAQEYFSSHLLKESILQQHIRMFTP